MPEEFVHAVGQHFGQLHVQAGFTAVRSSCGLSLGLALSWGSSLMPVPSPTLEARLSFGALLS